MTENMNGEVWEEPTLEVLGDLASLTAAGGVPVADGIGTTGAVSGP